MAKKMNKILVLGLFLGGVTLGSAGILTGINLLTAPAIEHNQYLKKYEGYKKILEIDTFDDVVEMDIVATLKDAGVTAKQKFMVGNTEAGVVYDATVKGWNEGLVFQVGFKGNVYAGFNLVSSNETASIGGEYLKNINERLKGKPIDQPILTDDSSIGVTAPVTGNALKKVLEMCATDYAGGEIVTPELDRATIAQLNSALNVETATSFEELDVSSALKDKGIVYKYEVKAGDDVIGTVYHALVDAFSPDLEFLVGFSGENYAGFVVIHSAETPDYGGEYLEELSNVIPGTPATDSIVVDDYFDTGVTRTRNAVDKAIAAAAADYLEGRGE